MDTKLEIYSQIQNLVKKDAEDVATEVYNKLGTEYGVPQVPAHAHDGSDSLAIPFDNLANAINYAALQTTSLTPAQVKALNTTPITIVPAPGIMSVIIVESIDARINYAGTAYTGANALEFRYTNGAGAKVSADISTTFLNSSASTYSHVAGVTTELVPVANAAVVVRVPVANPATGNSAITFVVKYRVVSYPN